MPPQKRTTKNFDRVDEIHRFFMNPALCHAGSRIHKVLSTLSKVIGDLVWGGGHSTSAFYFVILGYSRKYPHTPMDDIGNPVRNAQ